MMRIAMVSPTPPVNCGVVDYTARLIKYLRAEGHEVLPVDSPHWGLVYSRSIYKKIVNYNPDILHIQYPTVPYGRGLAPQALVFLSRAYPTVVTIHEFSQSHLLRRVAITPFAIAARRLIFTNLYEQTALSKWFPLIKVRSEVIPIGSNIPFLDDEIPRDPNIVVFFGLIRPNRGLEEFIALVRQAIVHKKPYSFKIIGSPQEGVEGYFLALKQQTQELPNLAWNVGLDPESVARELAKATFAYLHFPDGASERRASLLAAIGNGVVVLTTKGLQTPPIFSGAVEFVESPAQALKVLDELRFARERLNLMSQRAREIAGLFSWDMIARLHIQVYKQMTNSGKNLTPSSK